MITSKKIIAVCIILFTVISQTAFAAVDVIDVFEVSFEDFNEGAVTTTDNYTVTVAGGDSVSVLQDGSFGKALKFIRAKENINAGSDTIFTYKFPNEITSGKIIVSYDMRLENFRSRMKSWGSLRNDLSNVSFLFSHDAYLYAQSTGSGNFNTTLSSFDKSKYYRVERIVDIDNGSYELRIYDGDTLRTSKIPQAGSIGSINAIQFSMGIQSPYTAYTPKVDGISVDEEAVYWIDNIKVQKYGLKVLDTSPGNNQADVSINTVPQITFNTALKSETITTDNILLYEGEAEIPVAGYTVSAVGESIAQINYADFKYSGNYSVIVKKQLLPVSGYSPLDENYSFSFTVESLIKSISNLQDGGRYIEKITPNIQIPENTSYHMTLKKDGDSEIEYTGGEISEIGSYKLKITATNSLNNKTDFKEISFVILGEVPPEAKNIAITGQPVIGAVLEGSYNFFDENNDSEGATGFRWLKSKSIDGIYTPVLNATERNYTLTNDDIDYYLKFEVTPVANKEPFVGEPVLSPAFISAFEPVCTNIVLTGKTEDTLTADYEYSDLNGDIETVSVYKWHISDKKEGVYTEIPNETEKILTLTAIHNDKFIKFSVTPKNNGSGLQNKIYYSTPIAGAFRPVATNLKIIGSANISHTVGCEYSYYDENGDSEGSSICTWYVNGSVYSAGQSLTITSGFKSVYFTVTPVSSKAPFSGETAVSDTIHISGSSVSSSSGGGGGIIKVTPLVNQPVLPSPAPVEKKEFLDIENHWAKNEIEALAGKNIVNGSTEELFNPDENITRAEFAAIISRAFSLIEDGFEKSFTDVKNSDWYYGDVKKIAKAGYMNGDGSSFRPNEKLTREELAVIISNILKKMDLKAENDTSISFDDDDKISGWAKESVYYACGTRLMNGIGENLFAPDIAATRAESAVLVIRILKKLESIDK